MLAQVNIREQYQSTFRSMKEEEKLMAGRGPSTEPSQYSAQGAGLCTFHQYFTLETVIPVNGWNSYRSKDMDFSLTV